MKFFFRKLLPFLSIFLLISCTNGTSKGSLSITLGSSARSAEKVTEEWKSLGLTAESFDYELLVIYPDESEVKETLKWGDTFELTDLDEGSYTVKIEAKKNVKDIFSDKTKDLPVWLKYIFEKFYPDLKEDEIITFYKGSQTKDVIGGEVTTFDIKLKNALTEPDDDPVDDDPADEPSDCPFYTDPLYETQFHTVKTLGNMMQPVDAFDVLEEGQYFQIFPETCKDEETQFVKATINLVTPKKGQEPDVKVLKENCVFYGANYFCILLMDSEEEDTPYLFLTEYAEEKYKDDKAFLTNLVQICINEVGNEISNFFDFTFTSYNAIQITQYMPQAYDLLWKKYEAYKLHKNDSALGIERPYYLNELEEADLRKLGIARIIINASILGEVETGAIIYAMAGNSVSLPVLNETFVFYHDKELKYKVDGSSITVGSGDNNFYFNGMENNPEGGDTPAKPIEDVIKDFDLTDGSYALGFITDDEKVNGKYRHRTTLRLESVLCGKQLSEGDTVVFTVSWRNLSDFTDLGAQLVTDDGEGFIETYEDQVNTYVNLTFEDGECVAKIPMNFISLKRNGEDVKLNAIQLFYDDDIQYVPAWEETSVKVSIYPADTKTLFFGKSWGYDGSGSLTKSLYRDVITLLLPEAVQTKQIQAGQTLKIKLQGTCSETCAINTVVFDEDPDKGYFHAIGNPATYDATPGINSEGNHSIKEASSSSNLGRIKLQLYVQRNYTDGSFEKDFCIHNFGIEVN